MANTTSSNPQEPSNHRISLDNFLSDEESKLLDLIPRSSLNDDARFELENIIIPSVKEDVEKILQGYLGGEPDMRLLGDPKVLPKVMEDLGRVDWNLLGNMKKRMVVREMKWRREMEEGYMEVAREKMREMYSLEEWMNLTQTEKWVVRIMIGGKKKGLIALATFFKTGGRPINNDNDMQNLLRQVYAEGEFQKYHQWIVKKIKTLYSLEGWINLSYIEKWAVNIIIWGKEKRLIALSSFFGAGGNPVGDDSDMQNFLEQIYAKEEFRVYRQWVKEKMKAMYSIEQWMNMTTAEKRLVKVIIGGKEQSLYVLATLFKAGGNPISNDGVMQELIKKIYTPGEFKEYHQLIKERIQNRYSLEQWMNLTYAEKWAVKILIWPKEMGLRALATLFSAEGNPVDNENSMQNFLKQIFPQEELQKYHQCVKGKIRARYSLDEWMNLTYKEKWAVKISIWGKEKGLVALTTLFKIEGNPANTGDDMQNILNQVYTQEEFWTYYQWVKEKIQARYSLEQWMSLTTIEKWAVKIVIWGKEKGLMALAVLFKTGGRPINNSSDFRNFMIKIYGEEEVEHHLCFFKTNIQSNK